MKTLVILLLLAITTLSANAHEMQHGFIISKDDSYFSHLVAPKHHSWQLSLSGELKIDDREEEANYQERKRSASKSYFLFQAQKLDLPKTYEGQILKGHIVESPEGDYTPQNIIVREATIRVKKVHVNVVNPFFVE